MIADGADKRGFGRVSRITEGTEGTECHGGGICSPRPLGGEVQRIRRPGQAVLVLLARWERGLGVRAKWSADDRGCGG